jgi:YD repeat-containing protein
MFHTPSHDRLSLNRESRSGIGPYPKTGEDMRYLQSAVILFCFLFSCFATSQTATYHLHKEASTITTTFDQLKTAGPDAASVALTTTLTGKAAGEYVVKEFETQTGVPNLSGVIPSGSTLTFSLWMRKTANTGTVFPRAKIRLNNATGTLLCTATGATALTTTVANQSISCATTANISMAATDRFYLWVGVNLTVASATAFSGELDIEGTLNGNFDSQITLATPTGAPTVTSLTPSTGAVGSAIVVAGTNFRSAKGSSTITFNGTSSTPTAWSASSITAPVPTGATTGNVVVTVGGQASSGVTFTVTPAPVISSLAPNSGAVGSSIVIAGSNFGASQGNGSVTFNGTTASIVSWSASSITATLPAGATTGNVVVTAAGGVASGGVSFTVTAAPSISSLSPTSGTVGSSVVLTGSNFGATQGNGTVTFNGTAATVSSWSNTSITATVPAGATSGNAVVTAAGGVASNGVSFTVIPTPAITSLSPASGPIGASVSVSGSNFGATQGSSAINFNGVPAAPTSWSATSIIVPVPAGATTGNVIVTVGGLDSNGASFTVVTQPHISSVAPNPAAIGASVTITGANFGVTQSISSVTFNGAAASPVSWSPTTIVTPVPTGATTGNIVVTVGGQASNGFSFTVTNPAPGISSLSPTSGAVGTPITISGSNFGATQGASAVSFNGAAATPTSWSSTSIVAPVPTGATTGYVVVTVNSQASNSVCFALTASAPCLNSLSPASGSVGTSVTISGINFGATQGTSSVTFNGTAATVSSWSSTSVVAAVPSGASSGNVVVTVGGAASVGLPFAVPAPNVSNLTPDSGRVGVSVTITGANFGSTQGSSTVTFNGTRATPTSWSNTSIVAPVPAGATSGPVVVAVGTQSSSGVTFTITAAANISSVTPASGPVNTTVTVAGVGFGSPQGAGTIKFNGTPATPFSWSDTSISAPVPAGATTGSVVVTAGGLGSNSVAFTVVPPPSITSISPTTAAPGTSITISGSNFGTSQGSSAVTFNGIPATATAWSATSVTATVPNAVSTGPVIVTVSRQASNGVTFTATVNGTLSGTVTNVSGGAAISGATVQLLQKGTVKSSATTGSNGSYTAANILAGSYDVQVSAAGFGTALKSPVTITAGQTATANFALSTPGTISGKVTLSDGITAISGASVQVFAGREAGNTATTDSTGSYSLSSLSAGNYTLRASASGYVTRSQLVTLAGGGSGTANFALQAPGNGAITYVYDELGRVVGVVDSSGDTATYTYDAVGNVLSIGRYSSAQVSIISFTPSSATVGTTVNIYGTGFSATASQDAVAFNGVSATVTSATSTQIVTSVPAGATTGPITITAPAGTATSSTNFTVAANSGAPTITSFNPTIGTAGTAVTVTGTNFDSNFANKLRFNITRSTISAGTTTSISTVVPAATGSGHITVNTPSGSAVSSQDFYIPFGSHVAADVGYTGRTSIGGSQTVTLSTANKIGLLLFDATAGQGVNLQLSGSTFASCTLLIFDPTGNQLGSSGCTSATAFVNSTTLPVTGTYTLGIDPSGGTGSITIGMGQDVTSPILVGGPPVTVTTTLLGQDARLTFSGTAGQRVSFNITNSTYTPYYACILSLLDPSSTSLTSGYCGNGANPFIDSVSLGKSGTYTVLISPQATTGSVTVQIYNASDVTGTIAIDGAAVTTGTTTPGQDARLTFSGAAGQRIVLQVTNVSNPSASVVLLKPDGTTQTSIGINNSAGQTFFMDTQVLATTGTYTLWVQHNGTNVGSETLQLNSVPADLTGTITIGGAAVRVPTTGNTAIGQNASLTFSATAGQRVSINVTNATYTPYYGCMLTMKDPSGTYVTSGYCGSGASPFIDSVTLATAGTYTLFIDPQGTATGNVTLSLNNDSDVTGTIAIDGAAVTASTTVLGQDARLTFSGTAGQRIVLQVTNVSNPSANVALVKPDGTTQTSIGINNSAGQTFFMDTQALATTGTYTLWVQHNGTNVGSETLQLNSVPADFTGTITIGGAAVQVPTTGNTAIGQNASLTFSATAGQQINIGVNNGTYTPYYACLLTLRDPSSNYVTSGYCGSGASAFVGAVTLATAGTYTIFIDPQGTATGNVNVQIINASDVTGTIAIDGAAVTATTTNPGQDARLTFSGTAGQRIVMQVTNVSNPSASVALVKPDGTTQTSIGINNSAGQTFFMDTQVLATTGTYTLWVQHNGTNVGSETLQLNSVPADLTGTITIGGAAVRVPTTGNTAIGQNASLTFTATAGQRVSMNISNGTYSPYYACIVTMRDPSGTYVTSGYCGSGASPFIDSVTLATAGTYTLFIDPQGTATGNVTLSLNNDSDVTGTIAIDGAVVTASTTVLGQDARLTFSGTAGQRIVLQVTNVSNPSASVALMKPDGTTQTSIGINNSAGQTFFMDTQVLATTGTYTLWVQHSGTNVGSETLQLNSVPADFTGTITIGGAAVRLPTTGNTAIGQNASLTFTATAGQRVSMNISNGTYSPYYACIVTMRDPSGTYVTSGYCGSGASPFIDSVTLATAGTYTIFIDPQGTATGNVTLSLNNDSDVTGTIAIDGAAVTTSTTVLGQDARLTFSGTAGQRIVLQVTNVSNPSASVALVKPDGTTQTSIGINNSAGQTFFMDTQVLATTGTYTLWVQHSGTNVGSETLQLNSVPADFTGTITIGGAAVQTPTTGNTAVGQNAILTFSGTAGQQVTVNVSNGTYSPYYSCILTVKDPSGSYVTSGYCGNGAAATIGPFTTNTTGSYTILVDPQGTATGSVNVGLVTP